MVIHIQEIILMAEAEEAVEIARENVANIIKANPKEIIFTLAQLNQTISL